MANVRVDMLQIRKSDNMVLAATHGRGLFTMTWDISTSRQEKLAEASSVFPNPSKGQVRISAFLDQPGNVNLSVTNLSGKMVYQETQAASAGYFSKQINLETLPKGTYLVILTNAEKTLISSKTILY